MSRRETVVRTKSLSIAIDGCSPGAVIDAQGMHNIWTVFFDAQRLHEFDVMLSSLDPECEGPDGEVPGFAERKAKREAFLASVELSS